MRKRQGFTLVEMLVSMALILFVMVLLTAAFSTGLQVFRQLKGLGDMEERLRSSAQILRRDLAAYHFENYRKLSDSTFWTVDGPPLQGFFRIWQSLPVTNEGADADSLTSSRSTSNILHFTSKLSGTGPGDFATSGWPNLTIAMPGAMSTGQDNRFNPLPVPPATLSQYRARWYEVAYFLQPNNLRASGTGVPLYTLYRRQRGIIDNANQISVAQPATLFPDLACQLNSNPVQFLRPEDLAQPNHRFGVDSTTGAPSVAYTDALTNKTVQTYPCLTQAEGLQGADLLLSDVVSFEVKALAPAVSPVDFADVITLANSASTNLVQTNPLFNKLQGPMVFDTWTSRDDGALHYSQWNQTGSNTSAPLLFPITALKITIRVWDAKTLQARQITIIQDM